MKKITLHAAAASNGGSFLDAGTTVSVGDKDHEISLDRAKGIVAKHVEREATAPTKRPPTTRAANTKSKSAKKPVTPPAASADTKAAAPADQSAKVAE